MRYAEFAILPNQALIRCQQLRIVDRAVVMHLSPAAAIEVKHACSANLHLQFLIPGRDTPALSADHVKNLSELVQRVIVKLEW